MEPSTVRLERIIVSPFPPSFFLSPFIEPCKVSRLMDRYIALFTGGRESVFSVLEVKRRGYKIAELVFLEKPVFSVHEVDLPAGKAVERAQGYELKTVNLNAEPVKDESLIQYLERRKENGIDGLITGNVKSECLHDIYDKLCTRIGIKLVEPLWNHDTYELLARYIQENIKFIIIGIRKNTLPINWLGRTVNRENVEDFIADCMINNTDPCGEYGEFHTLTISSPAFNRHLAWNSTFVKEISNLIYVVLLSPDLKAS